MRSRHVAALAADVPGPPFEIDTFTNPDNFLKKAQAYDVSRVRSMLGPILDAHPDLQTHPALNRL